MVCLLSLMHRQQPCMLALHISRSWVLTYACSSSPEETSRIINAVHALHQPCLRTLAWPFPGFLLLFPIPSFLPFILHQALHWTQQPVRHWDPRVNICVYWLLPQYYSPQPFAHSCSQIFP